MALPQIDLEVDLGHQAGLIRALNGVNLGPLSFNGWLDLTDEFKKLGFPQTRLHDWPRPGKAVCKRYLLDYDRNLTLVGQEILDEKIAILRLCMPAPAFSYLTLTPDGKDADSLGGHLAN